MGGRRGSSILLTPAFSALLLLLCESLLSAKASFDSFFLVPILLLPGAMGCPALVSLSSSTSNTVDYCCLAHLALKRMF